MCISSISSKQILLIYTDIVCEIRWIKLSWYPQSFETIGQMKWVLWSDDGYFARFQGLCSPSGRTSYRTISSTRPRKVSEARDPVSELSNCFEIWCEVTANFKAIRTFNTRSRAFHALRELMIRRLMRYLIWPQASLYTVVCINKSTIRNHPNPAGKRLTAKLQKLDFSVYYMLCFFVFSMYCVWFNHHHYTIILYMQCNSFYTYDLLAQWGCQWTGSKLSQIMTYWLSVTSHYPTQWWLIIKWTPKMG